MLGANLQRIGGVRLGRTPDGMFTAITASNMNMSASEIRTVAWETFAGCLLSSRENANRIVGLTAIFRLAPSDLFSGRRLSRSGPFRGRLARRLALESIALYLYTIQLFVEAVVHSSLLLYDFPELGVL